LSARASGFLLIPLFATACEFGEVVIPDGEPLVIVQAVMRPDQARQWIVVEEALTGTQGLDSVGTIVPGVGPEIPVRGATVTVVNLNFTDDPCGATLFTEIPNVGGVPQAPGLYWGPEGCPAMRTGDTLALRVVTLAGDDVRGTTVIPGAGAMVLVVGSDSVVMPGPAIELNRDVDTLRAHVREAVGRALQLEVARPDSAGGRIPGFWFVVDSNAIKLPGNLLDFVSPFKGGVDSLPDDLPPVFAAGRTYTVTLALTDERYFDFVRSFNLPLSGRGFINQLTGGLGVFGSMITAANGVRVVGNVDDDREGAYRLHGTLLGVPVDVTLELYVAEAGADSTALSSFVTGTWLHGAIDGSADGMFRGDTLALAIFQALPTQPDSVSGYLVAGSAGFGAATTVTVYDPTLTVVDSLVLEGPAR
jgi:hypothetical protein